MRWLAGRVPAGLGHPLSRLPRVQEKVGQIAGLLLVNRSLLEQAAALRFSAIEANLAKVTITDNAIQAVNIALELTGNHGLSRQNPLERHYRNVLCGRVHTHRATAPGWQLATSSFNHKDNHDASIIFRPGGGRADAAGTGRLRDSAGAAYPAYRRSKGGMRSQLEAANALQNLPYDIKWAEFPAAAPLAEALNAGAVDAGIIGDAPLLFARPTVRRSKLLPWIKQPGGDRGAGIPGSTLKAALI
nr:ABC transporter, substrate-binding protein, aliphatic sulfonates family [Klebsiella pneumoniae]